MKRKKERPKSRVLARCWSHITHFKLKPKVRVLFYFILFYILFWLGAKTVFPPVPFPPQRAGHRLNTLQYLQFPYVHMYLYCPYIHTYIKVQRYFVSSSPPPPPRSFWILASMPSFSYSLSPSNLSNCPTQLLFSISRPLWSSWSLSLLLLLLTPPLLFPIPPFLLLSLHLLFRLLLQQFQFTPSFSANQKTWDGSVLWYVEYKWWLGWCLLLVKSVQCERIDISVWKKKRKAGGSKPENSPRES